MGKNKEQRTELQNAFSRMNYLYQASILASQTIPKSVLANYYGKIMREVAKKVVEKIHPDIKRTLCSSCSYPMLANENHATVKVKPHKKRKNKQVKKIPGHFTKELKSGKTDKKNYPISQMEKRNLKPNRLIWNCNNCGYSRTFLQRPSHDLWIQKCESSE